MIKAGYDNIPIAVNISSQEFAQKDFIDRVLKALEVENVPPNLLEIELTERSIMSDTEDTIEVLRKLHLHGINISVDDFGTGYSSLSYLKRFPLDTLKIDRSFIKDAVQDSDDAAIVSAIFGLAHSLKLRVIAEGVETKDQIELLGTLDCFYIQGYYYSKPLPFNELMLFLENT